MKIKTEYIWRSFFGACLFAASQTVPLVAQVPQSSDVVFLARVSPTSLLDGEESSITVTVYYRLESQDSAVLELSTNSIVPRGMSGVDAKPIKRGTGEVTFETRITPRIWTTFHPFAISAGIRCQSADKTKIWLSAVDERKLQVDVNATPRGGSAQPPPEQVFEDGIIITSVSPEVFKEGLEQEITVRVRYELLARASGEINLGSNEGRANGYRIVGSKVVEIGSGEAEIRAKIVAAKTRGLPFCRIHVNLSEYPHRKEWVPLATDVFCVPVE